MCVNTLDQGQDRSRGQLPILCQLPTSQCGSFGSGLNTRSTWGFSGVQHADARVHQRPALPNLSQALLQAFKLRTDLRFHGVL